MLVKILRPMLAVFVFASLGHAGAPANLAPQAKISADSEHSSQYKAAFVANGVIPEPMGKNDLGLCWVVKGTTHGKRARITFEWPAPVTVAEAVYFGRTGWHWGENFRDYVVWFQ